MSTRRSIEEKVLQDLMYSVIHVASPATFESIITVLEPFHKDKKNRDVAALLHQLYSPILWRSLGAANPLVRKNSLIILEKVFPLHNPFSPPSQNPMKEAVLKCMKALQIALGDIDPSVRVTGSNVGAKICATYWEALPPQEIRSILNCKWFRQFISDELKLLLEK
jgi:hypothetical protein